MTMMKKENLIVITTDKAGFEYDIHALVKAFYPACEVKVFVGRERGFFWRPEDRNPGGHDKAGGKKPPETASVHGTV